LKINAIQGTNTVVPSFSEFSISNADFKAEPGEI